MVANRIHSACNRLVANRVRATVLGLLLWRLLSRAWTTQFRQDLSEAERIAPLDDLDESRSFAAENRVRHRKVGPKLNCSAIFSLLFVALNVSTKCALVDVVTKC